MNFTGLLMAVSLAPGRTKPTRLSQEMHVTFTNNEKILKKRKHLLTMYVCLTYPHVHTHPHPYI